MSRTARRATIAAVSSIALAATMVSPALAETLAGTPGSILQRQALTTPEGLASPAPPDLQYADPSAGLSLVDPPSASSSGSASLSYPIVLPKGRGLMPHLSLDYDSGNGSSWVGQGWDFGVGEVSVDTTFGVPKFCPRTSPPCGNFESESYRLDGDLLMPNAQTASPQPRVSERHDWTRQVETQFERIERHGTKPGNYSWEVTDKDGNVSFYGMFPDQGGFAAGKGTRTSGPFQNDRARDPSSILTDADGHELTWYLTAQRDVGVNMIRYEYETVYYRATTTQSGNRTQWEEVAASSCTADVTCAKHVYLSKLFYTGAGELSGHDEDPAYEVDFLHKAQRSNPTIDARGGFLDLARDRLTAIQVFSLKPTRTQALEYRLAYTTGPYAKDQLTSITQVGCAGPSGCDAAKASAVHTFTYYDDAKGTTLAAAHEWNTQDNSLGSGRLEGRASALGMSSTNAGDGHLYLGFNLLDPEKTGSFGGSITVDGSTTDSLVEFMDINGDGLPDKVFRDPTDKDNPIWYTPNTSKPGDAPDRQVTYGEKRVVDGLSSLPIERSAGFGAAIEAYLVVSASFGASGSWNWSDGYFNDVNGDGLPDFIRGGSIYFNHLTCTGSGDSKDCVPHFAKTDQATRVPLTTQPVSDAASVKAAQERHKILRRLSPPIDTVRRWVAPFDGTVTIDSTATLLPCLDADLVGGVCPDVAMRLSIQKEDTELDHGEVKVTGDTWSPSLSPVPVTKGQRLYFRAGADADSVGRTVSWDPTITYTSYGSGSATPPADANGLSQKVFTASDDFTLAGRPGGFVGLPVAGDVLFGAEIDKGVTSDDVRPTMTLTPGSGGADVDESVQITPVDSSGQPDPTRMKSVAKDNAGKFCVTDGSGTQYGCYADQATAQAQLQILTKKETGRFVLGAKATAAAPVTDSSGNITGQDHLNVHYAVDSPIDVNALRWVQRPRLCYSTAAGTCDPKKPDLTAPVDTDIYPNATGSDPRSPWHSTVSGDARLRITYAVGDLSKVPNPGKIVLTVKTAADGYVLKKEIDPKTDASPYDVTMSFTKGTDYWFDLSMRVPGLGEKVSGTGATVLPKGGTDPADTVTVPLTANTVGRQGYFPLAYRGWGVAGYLANEDRGGKALVQGDFDILPGGKPFSDSDSACKAVTGGPCKTTKSDVDGMTFPGTYSNNPDADQTFDPATVESQFSKAYGYVPEVGTDQASLITETWKGPIDHLFATRSGLGSALLGGALPADDGSNGLTPPQLEGSTGPVLAGMIGLGPASASFAFGWSRSFVDYMDMNGDGFPDKVTTESVTYTNPRGGQGCKQADGSFDACSVSRNGAVNQDTTFAVGGGLSGSPVGIKGNARGVPNATQGAAASKGGGTSTDEYGAGIGGGVGVSAEFGSPNAADPNWDAGNVDSNTTKLPGDPVHNDSTLAIQQVLADVNGDGLPDLVKTTPKGVFVYFNLGYAFAANSVPWASGGFESSEAYSGSFEFGLGFSGPGKDFSGGVSHNASVNFPRYSWADVNGDGILDALHRDDSNGTVQIAYGTGTGLSGGADLGVDDSVPFRLAGEIKVPIKDQIRQDQSVGYGGGADVTIGFGPLCLVACYLIVNPGVHFENSLSVSDVDLVDVNGDGFADSVRRVEANSSSSNQERLDVQLNTHGRTGLLKSVTNPFHGVTTLDYQRYGNTADHPGSLYALSKVSVDDARPGDGVDVTTTTMSYQGLGYDFLRRQDLGFARVESDELNTNGDVLRSTVENYRNDNAFSAGLLTNTTVFSGPPTAGKRLQRTLYDWNVLDGATRAPLSLASLTPDESLAVWGVPERVNETQQWFGPDGNTVIQSGSTHFTYDALGSPTTILDRGDPANPADDLTATIRYSDCAISASDPDQVDKCTAQTTDSSQHQAFWNASLCPTWVHTAAQYTVTDSNGSVVRYRDGAPALCDNDSVTELNELISGSISTGTYATTLLNYDNWGSYNRIVYPAGTDGSHYAVHYVYDDIGHANVATVTDYELTDAEAATFIGLGPDVNPSAARTGVTTTSVYDGPSGKVASTTDANATSLDANGDVVLSPQAADHTTTYAYDPMGRLASVTTPDHQTVTYAYDPGNAAYGYATAKHSDEFGPGGTTIDTATFVDGTGRVTQNKRTGEFYNGLAGTATGFVVSPASAFDALGREVRQWFPQKQLGGSLTAYQAPPTDSAPHTDSVFDGLDRVTSVTAPGNRTTTTAYSATTDLGRRLTETIVTDPLLRATRTLTDVRGLVRVSEDRPVNKTPVRTDYDYTALGDLTKVVTAGVTQSESTYDLLGNRLSTDTPDGGLTTWTYDAAGQQETSQSPEQFAANTQTTYRYAFENLVSIDYQNALPTVRLGYGGYDGVSKDGNGAGLLVAVKDSARTQRLAYDLNGQQASETTAMNDDHWKRGQVTTSFNRDYLGRLGSVTYIDGETVTNHYDAGGSLASITGAKACTDLGTLAAAIDATQTTISVKETSLTAAPAVPFTMTIDGEQLRVTARVPAADGTFTYTVERGINGTPLVPTAAPHVAGAPLVSDVALTCAYRYLDRQEYDEFGDIVYRQLGNSNRSWSERDPDTRALSRIVSTAPTQGTSVEGTLAAPVTLADGSLTVKEAYAPPPVPFTAQIGTEQLTVTNRVETATKGVFTYTVTRGQGGTTAVAHGAGETLLTDRVQQNLTYGYDKVGNLKTYVNDLPADVSSLFGGKSSQTYGYDAYYRVQTASGSWDTAPSTRRSYSLTLNYDDTSGNLLLKDQKDWTVRTTCTKNCKQDAIAATSYTVSPDYRSPQQHQLATFGADTYTYDRNGDVTSVRNPDNLREIAWDATGHMTMIVDRPNGTGGKPTFYTYDYQGNRAIETKETGRTWFVNPWTTVRDGTLWKNIWAGDERLGTKFSEAGAYEHKSYWFQKDLQGSTNVVSDESGSMFQHREFFPDGQVWVDESSTIFRSPYGAQGNYFDEDHNLSDFGQRWFDPRSQGFLSADPAPYDDPSVAVTDPTTEWAFTFARGNPLVIGDPDGRVGKFINPTVVQRDALTKGLTIDGKPLTTSQVSSINRQLALHRGLKGKLLFGALSNIERAEKVKKLTERFSTKPVLEFTFDLGASSLKTTKLKNVKLESVKLGAGVGPRKKFPPNPKPMPATQKNQQKSNGAGGNP